MYSYFSKSKMVIILSIISSCSFLYNSLFNRIPVIYLNHLIFKYIIYNFLIYAFVLMIFCVILFLLSNCKHVQNNSYKNYYFCIGTVLIDPLSDGQVTSFAS